MNFNPFDKSKADGTGRPKPKDKRGKRLICTILPEEVNGMKEAIKLRNYKSWAYAIAAKYNLTRTNFEIDEKTGGLYYSN